jgi:hypothetical protein
MPVAVVELLAPVVALTAFGAMFLIGLKMRYTHKANLMQAGDPQRVERLTDAVQRLHEDFSVLRNEVTELHERVDFAERVLTSGNQKAD